MQNRYVLAVLKPLTLALLLSLTAAAQVSPTTPAPQAASPSATGGQAAQPQEGQRSIDDELQLTSDQKQKIAAIVDDERKQMMAVRDDASLSTGQKQEQATQIRQEGAPKIRAVLTQEQLQKLAAIQAREQKTPANNDQSTPQSPQR